MRSLLYSGTVGHRRTSPKAYEFSYGVYYFGIDLDEVDEIDRRIKPFAHNRRGLLSFRDADHFSDKKNLDSDVDPGLRAKMRRHLSSRGIDPDDVTVTLLTNTRVFGYVFNPVSFYLVRARARGALRHVIAEVHNTHGEEHLYDLAREGGDATYRSSADKVLYVSPFIDMEVRYTFECREDEDGALELRIDEYKGEELFFQAGLRLSPRPLTNTNVMRMLARYPLVTLKTIALIHWHGLKLWLRGVKFHPFEPKEARP